MELYILITSIASFIGVGCIVYYLEKQSKTSLERFNKEREEARLSLQSLAAIHSIIEATQAQTNALLATLEANSAKRAEESFKRTEDASSAQNKSLALLNASQKEQLSDTANRLNALNASIKSGSADICKAQAEQERSIEKALHELAKQIESLRTSLEESIKF